MLHANFKIIILGSGEDFEKFLPYMPEHVYTLSLAQLS